MAKAAGNKVVIGHMTACDDKIRRWTTTQQPTNKRWRGGGGGSGGSGGGSSGQRDIDGILAAAWLRRGGGLAVGHSATAAAW